MMPMDNHWILPLRDGTFITIPPDKVAHITNKIENKEPIKTNGRVILYQDLAGGLQRYKPETPNVELAEQAAAAFNEPVVDIAGNVRCAWVKEAVSVNRWNKYYSHFSNYHKLGNHYDNILIAYRLPIHMLSPSVEKCSPDEVELLQKKLVNM